jgi:predicted nucleotidyltransferase component of viral defense system
MLNFIEEQFTDGMSLEEKAHLVRESLQVLILKIIYDSGIFRNLAFVGGTALRLLFNLRRFSEDIDFSLIEKKGYDFNKLLQKLCYQLKSYGFDVDLKENYQKTGQSIMFKFKNVLYDLKLSNLKTQKLFIRVEIDTNPPSGFKTDISLINKFYVFTVIHYDIPSLYAAKLHACFFRKYIKGRDFYDLLWYLGKKIKPNFELLNNAIKQTEGKTDNIREKNFIGFLKNKLSNVDFDKVRKDVERFLVDKEELKLLDKNIIMQIVK